jgi:hypothetical protein
MCENLVYPGSKWQMNNYRGLAGTKTLRVRILGVKTLRVTRVFLLKSYKGCT